jgi:hypothetical protein
MSFISWCTAYGLNPSVVPDSRVSCGAHYSAVTALTELTTPTLGSQGRWKDSERHHP